MREGVREGVREGGRKGGREGGREEGREGREGGREGREGNVPIKSIYHNPAAVAGHQHCVPCSPCVRSMASPAAGRGQSQ